MNEFEDIVHVFLEIMRQPNIKGTTITLPKFDYCCLTRILTSSFEIFAKETNILEINYPIFIVGNVNGSLFSLFEILKRNGVPPVCRYLFIGNCIGNEEFSYECFIFILAMKLVFPNHIFLIRGQNEFLKSKCFRYMQLSLPQKNESPPQQKSIRRNSTEHNPIVDSNILQLFDNVFSSLPLAAKVFNCFLCVNRSIPICLAKMANIDRHRLDEECQLFQELYGNASNELIMNTETFEEFFEQNSLTMIIRGANYVGSGVFSLLDGRITEIFSGINQNDVSAVLYITANDSIEVVELNQIQIIQRSEVDFVDFSATKSKPEIAQRQSNFFNAPIESTPIYLLNHPNTHFQSLEKIKKITRINKVHNQSLKNMRTQPFFHLAADSKHDVRSFSKKLSKLTFA